MMKTKSTFYGHPNVTVEYRPHGPVVVHNRRGSREEVRRSRLKASAAWLAGLAIVVICGIETGIAVLMVIGLTLTAAYWILFGRGWEEIQLLNNLLEIRVLPLGLGRGAFIDRTQVDRIQIEKDNDAGSDRYRVQIASPEGDGYLPSYGALSGIPTQDEATALAQAINQQFNLNFTPGVQRAALRSTLLEKWTNSTADERKAVEPYLPARQPSEIFAGKIHIKHSSDGIIVAYSDTALERAGNVFIAVFWLVINSIFIWRATELNLMPFIFWLIGIILLGAALSHTEIHLESGSLVKRLYLGTVPIRTQRIALANLQKVATAIAWDSYDNMYHRVVAQAKVGEDFVIIEKLPENDGHALVMTLHQHLGLPI